MVDLKFQWKSNQAKYANGEILFINNVRIGSYDYNSTRSKTGSHEGNDWVGKINLPGLQNTILYDGTTSGVKTKVENLVNRWFQQVLEV